jgi:hypothetical protein
MSAHDTAVVGRRDLVLSPASWQPDSARSSITARIDTTPSTPGY